MSEKREHLQAINTHLKEIRHRVTFADENLTNDVEQWICSRTWRTI
jgi:hypothetical protein